jgi:glycosyltransferase involved in cell wall biosynthesis
MSAPRLLGVLLCYNDADVLAEAIEYLRAQRHDLIVWDHGSTDDTPAVLSRYRAEFVEYRTLPRSFDFYDLYPAMSRHLIETYVASYDWISWPDQDEFLEGPSRSRGYADWLAEVCESRFDWIQFNNFNFWYTDRDDAAAPRIVDRCRHYALFPDCAPRIRAWRARATNVREFNHNPPHGEPWPARFNLRHYPMRSAAQASRRLTHDRVGLARDYYNHHYDRMIAAPELAHVPADRLHYDAGTGELDPTPAFNWRDVYGYGVPTGAAVNVTADGR